MRLITIGKNTFNAERIFDARDNGDIVTLYWGPNTEDEMVSFDGKDAEKVRRWLAANSENVGKEEPGERDREDEALDALGQVLSNIDVFMRESATASSDKKLIEAQKRFLEANRVHHNYMIKRTIEKQKGIDTHV